MLEAIDPARVARLTPEQRLELASLLDELKRRQETRKLYDYRPYPKQAEFHAKGATYRERLFRAGNQLGKTWASASEIAIHLTGDYPDWWRGKVWRRSVVGWAMGESMESTRDTMQRLLLGRPGEIGTGTIPGERILSTARAQGVVDAIDSVTVRHKSGEVSRLYFKAYKKGRAALQGETLDFAAMDEEPPLDIYTEALSRTNATKGLTWITFTPLLGMSDVVRLFLQDPTPDRSDTVMTIHDVRHYTDEERERIIASYPAHERKARTLGIPTLGSGRIFPLEDEVVSVEPFPLPDLWPRIAGIDFGWDHPSAAAWLAWDRDTDTVYVYDCWRMRESTPKEQAPHLLARGKWLPVAWPHDGLQHDKGSGFQLAGQYRAAGVNMLHEMAQFPETGDEEGHKTSRTSVEAGLLEMLDMMQGGRFKVFSSLNDWFEEFRLYHRKDGKVVKLQDDLMAATRYAYMMLRYAQVPPDPSKSRLNPRRKYDWRAG